MSLAIKPDFYWAATDCTYSSDDRQMFAPIPVSPTRKADLVVVPTGGSKYGNGQICTHCVAGDNFSTRVGSDRSKFFVEAEKVGHSHARLRKVSRQFARVEARTKGITRQVESAKAFAEQLEHLNYLSEVSAGDDPLISPQTAELARQAWRAIWRASDRRMPIPSACTGPDGQMLYAWDRGVHHLELEIIPDQPAELFYKNRESRDLWGENYTIGEPLPKEAVEKIRFFV